MWQLICIYICHSICEILILQINGLHWILRENVSIVFSLTLLGLEPTIYRIRGEHANHYAPDAVVGVVRWIMSVINSIFSLAFWISIKKIKQCILIFDYDFWPRDWQKYYSLIAMATYEDKICMFNCQFCYLVCSSLKIYT